MIKIYPLESLETLILQTLSPCNKNLVSISEYDLSLIGEDVLRESEKVRVQIKNEVFAARKKREIRLLVHQYYRCLLYLIENAVENRKDEIFKSAALSGIIDNAISTLEELLCFIERRFSNFLSPENHVPISQLLVFKKEILLSLGNIKNKKRDSKREDQIIEIVHTVLSDSILYKAQCKITYREILYCKELLKQIVSISDIQDKGGLYTGIDEVLIEMNFNCHPYIVFFIDQVQNDIALQENLMDKISTLLRYYKEFNQLLASAKRTFDPSRPSIKDALENWFNQEILYLEKKLEFGLKINSGDVKPLNNVGFLNSKIECDLSADQIALILRATDEARIVRARSMNYFFKMIVPHLSTPFKKDLSYGSVRSKSYTPEDRDKEISIATLERIIKKIKSY